MGKQQLNRIVRAIGSMTWTERARLIERLWLSQAADEARSIVERRMDGLRVCPGCGSLHVVRNGQARGLQRYKCRHCGRTFNALSGTPLARLRLRSKWLGQSQALIDGLSITKAAERLDVARSTAFRWRHRFLQLPQAIKAQSLSGIVEADETCVHRSFKGQHAARLASARPARARGCRASLAGMSREQALILVVRDRSGATTDQIVAKPDTAHLAAALAPVLAKDSVLCTDGLRALGAAARYLGVEHHAITVSAGQHTDGAWHIQNVNNYHSRLKTWLRRFNGVATSYLPNYLGWFRTLDRYRSPGLGRATLLALAAAA